MQRESFIFYNSFYKAISALPENEQLVMYKAITERALFGIEPELNSYTRAMYELILPQIKANEKRYLNGAKGGAPKGNQNARKIPKNDLETTENNRKQPNDNVNDNVNHNVNDNYLHLPDLSIDKIDYKKIINLFNSICFSLPKVRTITDSRKKAIKNAFIHLQNIEAFEKLTIYEAFTLLFNNIEKSDFLCGRTNNQWQSGFDWILKKSNLIKIAEGNYNNRSQTESNKNAANFYDVARYEKLAKELEQ